MYATDKRWDALGETLVQYSTQTEPGDRVLIIMRETETFPLARTSFRHAILAGAYPQTLFSSAYFQRDLLALGSDAQAEWIPELYREAMEWADVCIDLRGARNLYEYEDIDANRLAQNRRAEGYISALRTSETKWTICRVPNEAFAQQAGKSLDDMLEVFFDATLLDWTEEREQYERYAAHLTGTREARIVGPNTDLQFVTEGRTYVTEDGHINMPGGEVYTSPVEDSASGHIHFQTPAVFAGRLFYNIRLSFRDGVVVDATSDTNEDFLHQLLEMDEGARKIGEFGIGTNRMLSFLSNDILYDEKVYGTVHIALGRSYAACGGVNDSALHWDIIKDLRRYGRLEIDGDTLIEEGEIVLR